MNKTILWVIFGGLCLFAYEFSKAVFVDWLDNRYEKRSKK